MLTWWWHGRDVLSVLLALCVGNLLVTSRFTQIRAGSSIKLLCFLWCMPNKWINKHSSCRCQDLFYLWGWCYCPSICRDHYGYGLSLWEKTLQCNVVSHWLSPYPELSSWVWAQPMRDDIAIKHHLSLAEPIPSSRPASISLPITMQPT